jgi:hypothetical protein
MVKIFWNFRILPFGYLRVWPKYQPLILQLDTDLVGIMVLSA